MYNPIKKQSIIRLSEGKLYNIFISNKKHLVYCTLESNSKIWSKSIALDSNEYTEFSSFIDKKDLIHIIAITHSGALNYFMLCDDKLEKHTMLESKTDTSICSHLSLYSFDNIVVCLYCVDFNGKRILSYQMINNGQIKNPGAIDYIYNNGDYSSACDKNNNIYVFYPSDEKNTAIVYRKYIFSKMTWSKKIVVSDNESNYICPKTSIYNDTINLCYLKPQVDSSNIIYQYYNHNNSKWSEPRIIYPNSKIKNSFSLASIGNCLYVFWVYDEKIFSICNKEGIEWSTPGIYDFKYDKMTCIYYQSNNIDDKDISLINEIPASFNNGVYLAFCEFKDTIKKTPQNSSLSQDKHKDIKAVLLDGFSECGKNINDINTILNENLIYISNLRNEVENLKKEVEDLKKKNT